jgi:hypothetical protein
MSEYFAQMRRAGFDIGLSIRKLADARVGILTQLPPESSNNGQHNQRPF